MDDKQLQRARETVDEKAEEAKAKAEDTKLKGHDRPQDEYSVRAKNAGKGKKTADKWNQ